MTKEADLGNRIYEVVIHIMFRKDDCCCKIKEFLGYDSSPVECLNPGIRGYHYIRLLDNGRTILKPPSPKSCPFSRLARELPIHVKKLVIYGEYAIMVVVATKSNLRKLYKSLNSYRDSFSYRIIETKNLSIPKKSKGGLTNKQKIAISTAYSMGYFNSYDKAKIREVARVLGKSQSTVSDLIRRGIKRILDNIDLDEF